MLTLWLSESSILKPKAGLALPIMILNMNPIFYSNCFDSIV